MPSYPYIYTIDLVTLFAYVSKWANPHFALVSPLVNFKKRLFLNKHEEYIGNNRTNKHEEYMGNNRTNTGASETKLCSHVEETPFFLPMLYSVFPQKVI